MQVTDGTLGHWLFTARLVGGAAAAAWGWWAYAITRTAQFGPGPGPLFMWAVMALPLAVLPLLGLPWPRFVLALAAATVVPLLAAEATATYEEARFRRDCRAEPARPGFVFRQRAWPCHGNSMVYNCGTGAFMGAD